MRALEIITGHVIYNPAYTYKFQLKTTFLLEIVIVFVLCIVFLVNMVDKYIEQSLGRSLY